jgi:hypothetical protein
VYNYQSVGSKIGDFQNWVDNLKLDGGNTITKIGGSDWICTSDQGLLIFEMRDDNRELGEGQQLCGIYFSCKYS